ncbi:MAG: leucyl aminopeptidase [Candidatus Electryonea clarkiae]|nr:leucyl aminopeptidase [Candidatus Electryonea clarkiae]MDP8286219.1 leucyl aminopeptidase [Candidatus Electryonea clarkiae]
MQITVFDKDPSDVNAELLVAGLFKGENVVDSGLELLDAALNGQLTLALEREDFKGASDQTLSLYGVKDTGPRRVLIVGLGKRNDTTPEKIRRAYGKAGRRGRELRIKHACIIPPLKGNAEELKHLIVVASVEGFALATYRFAKYISKKKKNYPSLERLELIPDDKNNISYLESGAKTAEITVDATVFARDLFTTPGHDLYPQVYAEIAQSLESEHIKVEILQEDSLKKLKMGALLAVGQGSARPPVLIHLTYDPGIDNAKTFAIVGKGITFDAGGLDLKTAAGMRDMKGDMGGSAAVMGVFKALEKWRPQCRVEGFIPAAENMPGGNAYRPGDVITSHKGLTIEIDNTDAEGRLALADGLSYAIETVKPDVIIDIATLTGACLIALGHHATGMMGTDDSLAELLTEAGEVTGERVWRLPLWNDYTKQIASEIADMKNTGGRPGGAITAAAFLKEFVGDTPWIHLDIAGTADEVPVSYAPHKKLPTGVGVRLILEVLNKWA